MRGIEPHYGPHPEEPAPAGVSKDGASHRRPEPREPPVEVGLQILDILEANAEADRRAARRPLGRGAVGRAIERDGEALVACPGIAETEELEPIEERCDCGFGRGLQHDTEE